MMMMVVGTGDRDKLQERQVVTEACGEYRGRWRWRSCSHAACVSGDRWQLGGVGGGARWRARGCLGRRCGQGCVQANVSTAPLRTRPPRKVQSVACGPRLAAWPAVTHLDSTRDCAGMRTRNAQHRRRNTALACLRGRSRECAHEGRGEGIAQAACRGGGSSGIRALAD